MSKAVTNKYDWESLRVKFIKSNMKIETFAKAENINLHTFKRKVADNKWLVEREKFQAKVSKKATEKLANDKAKDLAKLEKRTLSIIKKAQDKVEIMIEKVKKPNELRQVTASLIDLQKGYRLSLDASTENQATQDGFNREEWLKKLSALDQI